MEVQEVITMITNNGFAIAMCLLMFYYMKNESKTQQEQTRTILEEVKNAVNELKILVQSIAKEK